MVGGNAGIVDKSPQETEPGGRWDGRRIVRLPNLKYALNTTLTPNQLQLPSGAATFPDIAMQLVA
jgi:hypothetical protein